MTDDNPTEAPDEATSETAGASHGAAGGPIDPTAARGGDGDRELWIPPDASDEEAAAIAAAIAAHLSDREREETDGETWQDDRWAFTGRLDAISRRSRRVPTSAPRDPWTASGRADRF